MPKCHIQKNKPEGYHFTSCGLDYVYLINGYDIIEDPEEGECLVIHDANMLHKEIAKNILLYRKQLTHQEIRFFRSLLQLTQQQLGELLGVDSRTIQRWESKKETTTFPQATSDLLRIIVWENYLDKTKAIAFLQKHREERLHYKHLEMINSHNNWKLAA